MFITRAIVFKHPRSIITRLIPPGRQITICLQWVIINRSQKSQFVLDSLLFNKIMVNLYPLCLNPSWLQIWSQSTQQNSYFAISMKGVFSFISQSKVKLDVTLTHTSPCVHVSSHTYEMHVLKSYINYHRADGFVFYGREVCCYDYRRRLKHTNSPLCLLVVLSNINMASSIWKYTK